MTQDQHALAGLLEQTLASLADKDNLGDAYRRERILAILSAAFNMGATYTRHAAVTALQHGALADIAAERRRQIEAEGWTVAHDDHHTDKSLALAAALYAAPVTLRDANGRDPWPWWNDDRDPQSRMPRSRAWDKREKHDYRRRLVIAGALLAAEIERLDRAAPILAEKRVEP